jgi:nucleoside-diphosphate-sugar epimerase
MAGGVRCSVSAPLLPSVVVMHTILGANGAVGVELVRALSERGRGIRLVSRRPVADARATEVVAADLADLEQTIKAVAGLEVTYLLVGLKYRLETWRELWPRIMSNAIEACKRAGAKLVFFDNVYAYGLVVGPMTERTPFNPCSRKGEIRAQIASAFNFVPTAYADGIAQCGQQAKPERTRDRAASR